MAANTLHTCTNTEIYTIILQHIHYLVAIKGSGVFHDMTPILDQALIFQVLFLM